MILNRKARDEVEPIQTALYANRSDRISNPAPSHLVDTFLYFCFTQNLAAIRYLPGHMEP